MLTAQQFRWLPNALTFARLALAFPVGITAIYGSWSLGLWLLLVALSTDFLDGLAAKKLNAQSKLGAVLDPIADSALVGLGFTGLAIGGYFPVWGTVVLFFAGLVIGSKKILWPDRGRLVVVRSLLSVACLFLSWIYLVWTYATLAYGWSWWYVVLTIAVMATSALLKRHRLRAWLARGQKA